MSATDDQRLGAEATAVTADRTALAPERTPRAEFQLTRRLVGASRWPLILLTAIYAFNVTDQFIVPTVFPLLKQEFGLSDTSLGVLSSSYIVLLTIMTVPFGTVADRFNRTRVISWGTTAWGATMIMAGLAWNYASLLGSRMLLGAWDPVDNPTSQSLLADYYPVRQRAKVMSVYQTGQLLGVFLIPVAAAMATQWGWRSAFFFLSVPAFVVAILARRLPEPVRGEQDRRSQEFEGRIEAPSEYDSLPTKQAYLALLRVPTFTLAMSSSVIGTLFFGSLGTWSPTFFVRFHDLSVSQAASVLTALGVGGLSGALLSGYVADYLNYRGFRSARVLVAAVARMLTFPIFYLAFVLENTPVVIILFSVGSLTLIAPQAVLNAARADVLHPSLRGRGTALDAVAQSIAAAVAPVLMGTLADLMSLRTGFQLLVPLVGVAGVILLFALATYVRDERRVREQVGEEARAVLRGGTTAAAVTDAGGHAEEQRAAEPVDILRLEDVDLSYGPIQVLFGTSFAVTAGGCHALLGRNGVGKTTLLDTVAGLLEPQAGRVVFDGTDITGVPPAQRVKLGITLMPGGRTTFPNLSVRDNLWVGSYPFHTDRALVEERLEAVREVFPQLDQRLDQTAGTLSGGEQQMMALGRSLMAGPRLLLIDEMSMGLAPIVTSELLRVVRRITELGTTVLLVEQSVTTALEVADSVLFMERGDVEDLGPAAAHGDGADLVRRMMTGQAT